MELTLGQAAEAAGRGKSTIHRALKNGTISGTRRDDGSWRIDPAELHRVFPRNGPGTSQRNSLERPLEHRWDGPGTGPGEDRAALAARVELLTEALDRERTLNDEMRGDLSGVRAELRASQERVVGLLAPPRRRWWPWR